jgi:hypothetical protein
MSLNVFKHFLHQSFCFIDYDVEPTQFEEAVQHFIRDCTNFNSMELYEAYFFQNYHVQHKSSNGIHCIWKPTAPS